MNIDDVLRWAEANLDDPPKFTDYQRQILERVLAGERLVIVSPRWPPGWRSAIEAAIIGAALAEGIVVARPSTDQAAEVYRAAQLLAGKIG